MKCFSNVFLTKFVTCCILPSGNKCRSRNSMRCSVDKAIVIAAYYAPNMYPWLVVGSGLTVSECSAEPRSSHSTVNKCLWTSIYLKRLKPGHKLCCMWLKCTIMRNEEHHMQKRCIIVSKDHIFKMQFCLS